MVSRSSPARKRQLERLGENVRAWRKLQGLSAAELARRAHVTRETLRAIETGLGSPRLESLLAVTSALGFAEHLVSATDPLNTDAGRALAMDAAKSER